MALADVAKNLDTALPWRTCATCHALNSMSTEDAATLRGLLADRNVKFSELADALAADTDSPTIDRGALSRHARGQCSAREKLR